MVNAIARSEQALGLVPEQPNQLTHTVDNGVASHIPEGKQVFAPNLKPQFRRKRTPENRSFAYTIHKKKGEQPLTSTLTITPDHDTQGRNPLILKLEEHLLSLEITQAHIARMREVKERQGTLLSVEILEQMRGVLDKTQDGSSIYLVTPHGVQVNHPEANHALRHVARLRGRLGQPNKLLLEGGPAEEAIPHKGITVEVLPLPYLDQQTAQAYQLGLDQFKGTFGGDPNKIIQDVVANPYNNRYRMQEILEHAIVILAASVGNNEANTTATRMETQIEDTITKSHQRETAIKRGVAKAANRATEKVVGAIAVQFGGTPDVGKKVGQYIEGKVHNIGLQREEFAADDLLEMTAVGFLAQAVHLVGQRQQQGTEVGEVASFVLQQLQTIPSMKRLLADIIANPLPQEHPGYAAQKNLIALGITSL